MTSPATIPSLRDRVAGLSGDARHEAVVAALPGGMTPEQFRLLTLWSADAEGRVEPPSVASYFVRASVLFGMWRDGLIERVNFGSSTPMEPYRITAKGRAFLLALEASPASQEAG